MDQKNCNPINNNQYELNIFDLDYLLMLIFETKYLVNKYNFIDYNNYKKIIDQQFQNLVEKSETFEEDIFIKDQYERVHFQIIDFLHEFKKNFLDFNETIEELRMIINVMIQYSKYYNSHTIYYEFQSELEIHSNFTTDNQYLSSLVA